jgi:hypothetical protein
MDITIFSTCKPFENDIAVAQYNAIRSWKALDAEVILLDDEPGTREAAQEFDCITIPYLDRNSQGIPMMASLFQRAEETASHDTLCYVNADIILLNDFWGAIHTTEVYFGEFLAVSHRYNLKITDALTFPEDTESLRAYVEVGGTVDNPCTMDVPCAIDMFCYTRGLYPDIPPFVHARRAWDNWLIWDVLRRKLPVVDITAATTIIHQTHDPYVPESDPTPAREHNRRLLQELTGIPIEQPAGFITHSSHVMTRDGMVVRR